MNEDDGRGVIRIPQERVRPLLGKDGKVRKRIEEKCGVKLTVQKDGEVTISGEPAQVYFASDVVRAIGRGFEPDDALLLMGHDYVLHLIWLKEIIGSDKAITRLKGRVIGEKGRVKTDIESATDSTICLYGNTIGIISRIDSMESAREAVGMLLDGAPHSAVTAYLAKARRRILQERLRS